MCSITFCQWKGLTCSSLKPYETSNNTKLLEYCGRLLAQTIYYRRTRSSGAFRNTTRKHSRRMHTAGLLTVVGGGGVVHTPPFHTPPAQLHAEIHIPLPNCILGYTPPPIACWTTHLLPHCMLRHPLLWREWLTGVKTLPWPKVLLRAVKITFYLESTLS